MQFLLDDKKVQFVLENYLEIARLLESHMVTSKKI